ncbi:MAG TPA: hypothetical protein VFU32_03205 [Ktedonobacterales bacterium]|nr:hypothetical protein [Ktedonobacterales bacterium]
MANQDSGAGQQYDEDIPSDQWTQQGKPQYDEQDIEGVMPRKQPQQRDNVSDQDQWEQQHGLSGQPFSPLDEEPEEEEEEWQEEEDVSHLDEMR